MNILTLMLSAYLAMTSLERNQLDLDPSEWATFKVDHNKSYESNHVEELRKTVYAYNKHQVEEHNAKGESWTMELNHLADMSALEVKETFNGFHGSKLAKTQAVVNSAKAEEYLSKIFELAKNTPIPEEVDWRQVPGRVGKVHDQGQCGSCWAFAAVGALEGQEFRRAQNGNKSFGKDDLVNLSVQNLLDCDNLDLGCNGGLMDSAFIYVERQGGIDDEKSYPYEAETKSCRFRENKVASKDQGAAVIPRGDEEKLKQVVALYGPVSVAIDASQDSFQLYKSGVYAPELCGKQPGELDHGVLVVGYGTDAKEGDYWIVKNSWTQNWGERGYIRMARNKNNNCGISTFAVIPIV